MYGSFVLPPTQLALDDLRVIHAVVRERGATRAARTLALSQSAVSHRLRLVEDRLGFALFERRGKQLAPLPAALRIAEVAERIVAPLSALEAEFDQGPQLPPLRLATQCYTGYGWLPPVLRQLTREEPRLKVEVVVEATSDPLGALNAGRLDLAVCGVTASRPRLASVPLFDDELVAVLPVDHPRATRSWLDPTTLVDEQLFLFELSSGLREHFRKRLFPHGGGFRHIHRVPLTEAIVALVRSGAGASILPRWSVASAAERGEVALVKMTRQGLHRRWHAVYSRQSPHRPALERLVEMLRQAAPEGSRPR